MMEGNQSSMTVERARALESLYSANPQLGTWYVYT